MASAACVQTQSMGTDGQRPDTEHVHRKGKRAERCGEAVLRETAMQT